MLIRLAASDQRLWPMRPAGPDAPVAGQKKLTRSRSAWPWLWVVRIALEADIGPLERSIFGLGHACLVPMQGRLDRNELASDLVDRSVVLDLDRSA